MEEFNALPASISHKELNKLMAAALKEESRKLNHKSEPLSKEHCKNHPECLNNWEKLSHEILEMLSQKNGKLLKGKQPEALIALGAMRAHISMALHAYKASKEE